MKLDGPRVREERERLALSIEDVSEKARVSPHTWIRAEHGDEIRPSSVRRIAEYLGVEPDQLMESPPVPLAQAPSASPKETTGAKPEETIVPLEAQKVSSDMPEPTVITVPVEDMRRVLRLIEGGKVSAQEAEEELYKARVS